MTGKNDLTEGVIWKKLVLYFLPIAAGTLFQQLYNTADAVIVGKFVGTEALAAVGGSPAILSNLLIGFFVALSGGAGVVIAQHHGAKARSSVCREIHTSMVFFALTGIIVGGLVALLAEPIMLSLKTPSDTLTDAVSYTRIYFCGCAFMLVFNMASGVLRALGDSRRPFYYLMISCAVNIVLDLYFVIVLGMGVNGAAWATVIAQTVSAVCSVIRLCRLEDDYRLRIKKLTLDFRVLGNMMRIGIPSGVQSAMYGVSNMILQTAVNSLGTVVVASWSMSGKIDGVYWATAGAFGTAVTNFIGQNFGAGKNERVRSCVKTSFILFSSLTVALSILMLTAAKPALRAFSDDPAVIDTTWIIIKYFIPLYLLWTSIEVLSGVLRGVGDAVKPVIIVALGVCLIRVIWMLTVFRIKSTLSVICFSYPLSWAVTDAALAIYYFKGSFFARKKRKKAHPSSVQTEK